MNILPLIVVVLAAILIVIGRVGRVTPVAIAGYILLAVAVVLYFVVRSR